MWKNILAALVAVPLIALLGGVGILAYAIGETWDQRNTDALVTSIASICAGGTMIVGILLALIVGVPLALRAYEGGGSARRAWPEQPPRRELPTVWQQPPMLTDKQQGQWISQGPQYDLWEGVDEPIEGEWRRQGESGGGGV